MRIFTHRNIEGIEKMEKVVVLNEELKVEIYEHSRIVDKKADPYRAVLIRKEAGKHAPNGNGDLIAVQRKSGVYGKWENTPGTWYAETLLGTDGDGDDEPSSDDISIDGDEWVVEAGMLDALKAYVRILIDEGNFMTDERQAKVADIRQRQQKIFGDNVVKSREEDILATYSKWGAK